MWNFYIKKGAGSLSIDGKIYNEGDKVETTSKIAKSLNSVLTSIKPLEEIKKPKEKEVLDETKTIKEGEGEKDVIEVTIPDLKNEGKELIIDVVSCEREDLEKVANAMEVKFPWNIGDDKLRAKIIKATEKQD